jgi:hypothetical protein
LRHNRTLLFRLYFLLAAGLVVVAALLDFGYRQLQARLNEVPDPWRDAALALVSERLVATMPAERPALAGFLSRTLDMPVQLLQADDVVGGNVGDVQELYDAEGRVTWLKYDVDANVLIRIGPVEAVEESAWLRLIPPFFYLAIFVFS